MLIFQSVKIKKHRVTPVLDFRKVNNGEKTLFSSHIYTQPRSQAIYGSLVETFGPYPQYYTRIILIFTKSY